MFDHLPTVTTESAKSFGAVELPDLLRKMTGEDPQSDLNVLCAALDAANPGLGKAVRVASGTAVEVMRDALAESDMSEAAWKTIEINCAVAVVAVLRLVDRAFEANALERKLGWEQI